MSGTPPRFTGKRSRETGGSSSDPPPSRQFGTPPRQTVGLTSPRHTLLAAVNLQAARRERANTTPDRPPPRPRAPGFGGNRNLGYIADNPSMFTRFEDRENRRYLHDHFLNYLFGYPEFMTQNQNPIFDRVRLDNAFVGNADPRNFEAFADIYEAMGDAVVAHNQANNDQELVAVERNIRNLGDQAVLRFADRMHEMDIINSNTPQNATYDGDVQNYLIDGHYVRRDHHIVDNMFDMLHQRDMNARDTDPLLLFRNRERLFESFENQVPQQPRSIEINFEGFGEAEDYRLNNQIPSNDLDMEDVLDSI